MLRLIDHIDPDGVAVELQGTDKSSVLTQLVDLVCDRGLVDNRKRLLESLWLREGIVTTGIGHGVAIPHADIPEIGEPRLVLGVFPKGVDFDSLDEEPVHLVFMLLGTPRTPGLHMKILARIARLAKDPGLREELCRARSADEALIGLRRIEDRH